MPVYSVDLPVERIWALIKRRAEGDFVNFHINARKAYRVVPRHGQPGMVAEGTLELEPMVERDYWILSLTGVRDLGPVANAHEPDSAEPDMPIEEFVAEFIGQSDVETSATVITQTEEARQAFEDWISPLCGRGPVLRFRSE